MLQRATGFTGYAEGWALYAEYLAWEMGLYEDDPQGNLGRLDFELSRAARLVVDTGIHAKGWTRQEAADYYAEATGRSSIWASRAEDLAPPTSGATTTVSSAV